MLSDDQLETLRAALTQQLAALRRQIEEDRSAERGVRYRDLAGEVTDIEDEAVGAELAGTENALIGHRLDEVREIQAALTRLAEGRYGRCVDCGQDISYARLTAYPATPRCTPCQAHHEKTYGGRLRPSL